MKANFIFTHCTKLLDQQCLTICSINLGVSFSPFVHCMCVYFKHPHESTCRCRCCCKLYGFQYLSFCRRGILFYLIHPLANVMLMKSYQTSCIHVAKLISIVCVRFNRMTTNRCASGCIFRPFVHVSQSPVSNGQCLNFLFIAVMMHQHTNWIMRIKSILIKLYNNFQQLQCTLNSRIDLLDFYIK